jgi:hypothetical protein
MRDPELDGRVNHFAYENRGSKSLGCFETVRAGTRKCQLSNRESDRERQIRHFSNHPLFFVPWDREANSFLQKGLRLGS